MTTVTKQHRLIAVGAVLLLAMVVSMFSTVLASAQSSDDDGREEITLSPTKKRHALAPSEQTNDSFKVVNTGTVELNFIVYARPFAVESGSYRQSFDGNEYDNVNVSRANAHTWVRFEQTQYSIEPGETVDVEYQLIVPEDAVPGGQYGVLFAETVPNDQSSEESVVRKKRVGAILEVSVDGDTTTSGSLTSSSIDFMQFRPPLSAEAAVDNDGTTDFEAELTLTVRDVFGNIKYSEARPYTIYPDTSRDISFEWADSSWFGLYNVTLDTSVIDQDDSSSSFVLMAPRWLLIVLVIALIGGGYATFRRHK